ncbi:uncharacterized protein Dana_GF27637, isoform C [Drosophila ananassae]|nr:uncharacterized protein LOC26515046 isoform X2 [Drosophila ananassae]KPU75570.1 uncharacterized protein Dana_GF27637, isoform A [Drosophila ananassae]KPU75572.1 uncharacterized protein Dana_GF27637, isoform C [Drosophila ananassae]
MENSTDLRSQQVIDSNDNSIDLKMNMMKRQQLMSKAKKATESLRRKRQMSSEIQKELDKTRQEIEKERNSLKRKQQIAEAQNKYRQNKQQKLRCLFEEIPEAKSFCSQRSTVGRPPIEDDQPLLHKTILEIALFESGADERRRTNLVRSVKTLSDLHKELKKEGFNLSRSATYLRLLPRRSSSIEEKRHVRTVPVKLSIKYLESIPKISFSACNNS